MNSSPLVSVGLFVYNGERFIEKQSLRILNQTFTDFELIISDNASTDQTAEIVEHMPRTITASAIIETKRIWAPAGTRVASTNWRRASISNGLLLTTLSSQTSFSDVSRSSRRSRLCIGLCQNKRG